MASLDPATYGSDEAKANKDKFREYVRDLTEDFLAEYLGSFGFINRHVRAPTESDEDYVKRILPHVRECLGMTIRTWVNADADEGSSKGLRRYYGWGHLVTALACVTHNPSRPDDIVDLLKLNNVLDNYECRQTLCTGQEISKFLNGRPEKMYSGLTYTQLHNDTDMNFRGIYFHNARARHCILTYIFQIFSLSTFIPPLSVFTPIWLAEIFEGTDIGLLQARYSNDGAAAADGYRQLTGIVPRALNVRKDLPDGFGIDVTQYQHAASAYSNRAYVAAAAPAPAPAPAPAAARPQQQAKKAGEPQPSVELKLTDFVPIFDRTYKNNILHLTQKDFLRDKGIVVFHSPRCPHCRTFMKTLDKFASEDIPQKVPIGKIDISQQDAGTDILTAYFGVKSLPTMLVYDKGRMMNFGNGSSTKIKDILQALAVPLTGDEEANVSR